MDRKVSKGASSMGEKPVLLEAINLTFRTMERRTRLYRNLLIWVGLTLLGSLIFALAFRKWVLFTGLLAPPLYVGIFLYWDARTMRGWCNSLLAMRKERKLDVEQLKKLLSDLRQIPAGTLQAMFTTLNFEDSNK